MYKTTDRRIYDEATARVCKPFLFSYAGEDEADDVADIPSHPEVLLHSSTHLLETATSNIAIQTKTGEWITPTLDREQTPFLNGVMRRYLLDKGVTREGKLTLREIEEAKRDGRRVIGFNGLR